MEEDLVHQTLLSDVVGEFDLQRLRFNLEDWDLHRLKRLNFSVSIVSHEDGRLNGGLVLEGKVLGNTVLKIAGPYRTVIHSGSLT